MELAYREMSLTEAVRISEIDARNFIKNVWRMNRETGEYGLVEINWTDTELPNGYAWHLRRYREALALGGTAFGCFDGAALVGYTVIHGHVFGQSERYVLLDQLFVSQAYRGKGIGKALFALCAQQGRRLGARKLYLCAGSSENTMAFYRRMGCRLAAEPDAVLMAEDPNDIQLEFVLYEDE